MKSVGGSVGANTTDDSGDWRQAVGLIARVNTPLGSRSTDAIFTVEEAQRFKALCLWVTLYSHARHLLMNKGQVLNALVENSGL